VAEAARNVVATGAVPLGITNCLNFGNPMKPEIFWQFHRVVEGISAACRALKTPVTGGNVSFYNENPSRAIYPTPVIGMVGLLEDVEKRIPSSFQTEDDLIFVVGETFNEIGGSHYLMIEHGLQNGKPPRLDLDREVALEEFLLEAGKFGHLTSCHDLSEGGLAVAFAEACIGSPSGWGAVVDHIDFISCEDEVRKGVRLDATLFGESQSRVIVTASPDHKEALIRAAQNHRVPIYQIGKVGGDRLVISDAIDRSVQELTGIYQSSIPERMKV